MISLIVTIACIILLSSLSIGSGVKYLRESKARDKENFVTVLSSAVSRREEETNLDSVEYPYLGYYISDSVEFESIFVPKVSEEIAFENGIWYVVDQASATSLGVKNSEDYVSSATESEDDDITVALVNYMTGEVYLIDMSSSEVNSLELSEETVKTGHSHTKNIETATCTEAVRCVDCGYIFQEALGHVYGSELSNPQPSDAYSHYNKMCTRCGMAGGYEAHTFKYKSIDDSGTWYHKKYCTVCNWNSTWSETDGKERCTIQYSLPTSSTLKISKHIKTCRLCGQTATEDHTISYRYITESMHEKYCSNEDCGYVICQELHEDANSDGTCDKCGHNIIDYGYPQLVSVVYYKSGASSDEDKYYAKYGDTVILEFTADRQIQNLNITIGGCNVNQSDITSLGSNAWKVEFLLDDTSNIPEGNLTFKITCESTSGVEMSPVTIPTDKKYITFDASAPSIEYIEKKNLS